MIDLTKLDPASFKSPIVRGAAPLSPAQFARRIKASLERIIPATQREQLAVVNPEAYAQIGQGLAAAEAQAVADNVFNGQLAAYRAALARLARYRLADGREEAFEDMPTGEFDPETGEALTEPVLVVTAIEPLPATIEETTYDDEGKETGVEDVPNPAIVQDDAERAEAQAVLDATPQEVIDFHAEA